MGQNAAPMGLGPEVERVPVPVLDHPGTPRHQRVGGLSPLTVVGRSVVRSDDLTGVGLSDQEGFLAGRVHPVSQQMQGPDTVRHRGGGRFGAMRMDQAVLHLVVGVAGGDVQPFSKPIILDGGAAVVDARRDELVRTGVLPDDVSLPADELAGQLGLEPPPGQGVLRLGVPVRCPEIVPGRQAVRPVDQPPRLVEPLHRRVRVAQMVEEPLEDAVVGDQVKPRLVVDLKSEDGRVVGVAGGDPADHPLGVEAEGRMGVINFLSAPPAEPLAGARLGAISGYSRASHGGTA